MGGGRAAAGPGRRARRTGREPGQAAGSGPCARRGPPAPVPGPGTRRGRGRSGGRSAPCAPLPGRRLLPGYAGQRPARPGLGTAASRAAGVGVQRPAEQRAGRARFHDAARVHDGDLGRQPAHHGQVVADVHGRHLVMAAQAAEGVQDVPLRGDVQAGGRLVQHDQRGPAGEGHGQPDPLLLAAGQLMRVPPQQLRRGLEVGLPHHLGDPGPGVTRGHRRAPAAPRAADTRPGARG